jgi:hypothetical protein
VTGTAAPGVPDAPCTAPAPANDVQAGGAVRVADPDGHTLAAGSLKPGIEERGRCNFGFEITAVPGGVDRSNAEAVVATAESMMKLGLLKVKA